MFALTKTNGSSLEKALSMSPDELIKKVKDSKLTGRGGAGFPTGLKWEYTTRSPGESYLVCNADEGEPGTFKDRLLLRKNPETVIEGMLIAAHAIGAKKAFMYLRWEYNNLAEGIRKAMGSFDTDVELNLVSGAGAYICGDETALLNSLEGRRGNPRLKPPYPPQKGLWQKPTCVNNVETLLNAALLFEEGWDPDVRLFSLSGNLRKPGVYEERIGLPMGKMIEEAKPDGTPKAISLGVSCGMMPYKPELPLAMCTFTDCGCTLGGCTVIVVNEEQSIPSFCKTIAEFFVHESCGKCVPCREGNYRVLQLLEKIENREATLKDLQTLKELSEFIADASYCPLGQSSTTHVKTALQHFGEEFRQKCR